MNTKSWKPTFVAITDKDFLLYDSAPMCKEEWASPAHSHSILATRLAVIVATYGIKHNISLSVWQVYQLIFIL
jgi:hypothetical protein